MSTIVCVLAGSVLCVAQSVWAVSVHPSELAETRRFVAAVVEGQPTPVGSRPESAASVTAPPTQVYAAMPPFSFTYADVASKDSLPKWPVQRARKDIDKYRIRHELTHTDPKTGLQI